MLYRDGKINAEAVQKWVELENADPRRVIDSFYAEDTEVSFPGFPEMTVRGREQMHAFKDVSEKTFRDRRVTILRSHLAGNSAIVSEGTLRAVSVQTGKAVELFFCLVWTINEDGLIVTERQYLQNGEMLAAAFSLDDGAAS